MAAQELQGTTLGEKHRQYNKHVKDALENDKAIKVEAFNSEDHDVKNLIKIDVAATKRDVNYILKMFKCEDMLYVSRAIKQSKWLITDRQYAHIINPQFLHKELFPKMMSKARSKLLLHIRLHLCDEDRVDDFYNYIKEQDEDAALRWLPNCSLTLTEKAVQKHHVVLNYDINRKLFKRLCEKSITLLEICIKDCDYPGTKLHRTKFLIGNNTDKYLDFVETYAVHQIPSFGPRSTSIIMKTCPQRILDKFEMYYRKIDLPTFAKHLKQEDIRELISKTSQKKEMESWFKYENIKHFVRYLPKEGRFDFLKKFFIEKTKEQVGENMEIEESCMKCTDSMPVHSTANIYRWYGFAPFELAFAELTKLIRAESAPLERIGMFGVLLSCAGRNSQQVQTILQYYNNKHINEPFMFKNQFVNMVLTKTDTHKFNETNWKILNNIFHSMEVYIESENNVQSSVEAIMIYKILHNESVPEIIESKFQFNSLKNIQYKLTAEEKEMIFQYLYNILERNIRSKHVNSEKELLEVVKLLEDTQTLFMDWNKTPIDCSWFLSKIEELIKIKNINSWKTDLSRLYLKKKFWRRVMFKESLTLYPSEEIFYNALKHSPVLISQNKSCIEQLLCNDNVSLQRVLRTMRVYWPQSLAAEWLAWYLTRLNQPGGGHKAIIRGFCTLSPLQQLIAIVEKYAPTDSKINWGEGDELLISLRKNFARHMHLSRPLLPLETALLYAKGDYLQFILPSLVALLHNMSAEQIRTHVFKLLDAPVSLQKHGIRSAFTKLESDELKNIFHDIWKKTKNPSIRTVLFKQTYDLLCRQSRPATVDEIWNLLSLCIENLSTDENKIIYNILVKFDEVPKSVKGRFFMKSFKFLKTLPPHKLSNCNKDVDDLMFSMSDLLEHLDSEFVEEILLESLDKTFTKDRYRYSELMASYLLCAKDINSQSERFQKFLLPLLERSFALGERDFNARCWVSKNVKTLLEELSKWFQKNVLERNMVFPTKLFFSIEDELIKRLPVEEFYETRTSWKLFATFVKFLEEHKDVLATIVTELSDYEIAKNKADPYYYYEPKNERKYNKMYMKAVPKFSSVCLEYLREDITKYFPSIYWMFAKCLENAFTNINQLVYLECLKLMLEDCDFLPSYVMVLENLQRCRYDYADEANDEFGTSEKKIKEIREKILLNPSAEVKLHYYVKYPRHETC